MSAKNALPTAADPSVEYMGALIHELRESAGMTLADLSRVAGVSQGLLSQIERGLGNPAYLTLLKIARAFNVPVGRFFSRGEEPADNRVVRADSRRQLQVKDRGLVYELLTPTMNGDLLVLKIRIPPGYSNESVPSTITAPRSACSSSKAPAISKSVTTGTSLRPVTASPTRATSRTGSASPATPRRSSSPP